MADDLFVSHTIWKHHGVVEYWVFGPEKKHWMLVMMMTSLEPWEECCDVLGMKQLKMVDHQI